MKKYIFKIAMLSIVFWFAGCTGDSFNTEEAISIENLQKAGTGFEDPNTFDANGNLCIAVNGSQEIGTPMELWMGVGNANAGTLVGHVTFLTGPDRVRIELADDGIYPYVVNVIHAHFAETVDGIPHAKKGNPIPGQFEYNIPVAPNQSVIEFNVDFDEVGAIHVEVEGILGGYEGFDDYLPNDPVTLKITDFPSSGDPTYFKFEITDGGILSQYNDGKYEGWCIDSDHPISLDVEYLADIYSSLGSDLPEGIVEFPENLDLVNYLLNNYKSGDMVQPLDGTCGTEIGVPEALTYGDIQMAIWQLVDDGPGDFLGSLNEWSQARVDALLCEVNTNGDGYTPMCGDYIVFIAVPISDEPYSIQLIIGKLPVPCEQGGGTAWGDGKYGANFPGAKQWGTWFNYDPNCLP